MYQGDCPKCEKEVALYYGDDTCPNCEAKGRWLDDICETIGGEIDSYYYFEWDAE